MAVCKIFNNRNGTLKTIFNLLNLLGVEKSEIKTGEYNRLSVQNATIRTGAPENEAANEVQASAIG